MTDPSQIYAQALDAANRRDWHKARTLALDVLGHSPNQAGMQYVAGVANMELRQLPHAVEHLRRATALDPHRANFATQYAQALSLAGLPALAEADRAASLLPTDPLLLFTLGSIYARALAHERATGLFRQAIKLAPSYAACRYSLAMSLIFLGDAKAAEDELEACIRLDPSFWQAYLSRSLTRKQLPGNNHVEELNARLSRLLATEADDAAEMCLHMALAKEHEDLQNYPSAFNHLVEGKSTGKARRKYSIQQDESLFASITHVFGQSLPEASGSESSDAATSAPVFVFGMPRSGTTLVERILSSHPEVNSAGELFDFPLAFKRASRSQTRTLLDVDTVERAADIAWLELGKIYLESTRSHAGQAPRFTDKLPHNFLYAGAIARALPNASMICLQRDPMDVCLSNFRQLFAENSPSHDYSYDLFDIGHYYVLFDRLMKHWEQVLPGRILTVRYETLVSDQERMTRKILDHCGLPWHDACLRFEHNPAPAATASAVQVREPLNDSSIGRWKKYGAQLDGLRELLTKANIPFAG